MTSWTGSPSPCQVAILAGGAGTRLRARTGDLLPKPMVPVFGKPLLEHQILLCRNHGFTEIALLVHHQHEAISRHFGRGSSLGVHLEYAIEEAPRGTAGALRDALPLMAEQFLVLYGDTFLDVDLRALWETHQARGDYSGTLFLHPNDHPQDSDLVEIDASGRVVAIHPYPHPSERATRNLVNAGLYVLNRNGIIPFLPTTGKSDLAKHTFPTMLQAGQPLGSYVSPEYIKDLGTPERLDKVIADITSGLVEEHSGRLPRKAVFLDRDGTINREVGHLHQPDQLELLPGVASALRRINKSGHLAVVVTNQPVLARGDLSWQGLDAVHSRLDALLGEGRAYLDAIYVCPHHPHRGFPGEVTDLKVDCSCRKPKTGLIDQACSDLFISRMDSWLVGDTTTDMEAGRRAGLRTMLLYTGYAGRDRRYPVLPDYVAPSLPSAVHWIFDGHPAMRAQAMPIVAAHLNARMLLIGGLSRSGKSSFAQVLKEIYAVANKKAHILSLDSWLVPAESRMEGAGVLSRYDLGAAITDLREIARTDIRHEVHLRRYDPFTRAAYLAPVPLSIGPKDVLIVEGVPALASPELISMADTCIYMETAEEVREARLHENYLGRGLTRKQIEPLLCSRALDEIERIRATRNFAHFTLSSGGLP